jgi:hypothetical protein
MLQTADPVSDEGVTVSNAAVDIDAPLRSIRSHARTGAIAVA